MVESKNPQTTLNGYICFWKGKRFKVYAETTYAAQQRCARENKIKKSYEITVMLAEKGGNPVTHVASF